MTCLEILYFCENKNEEMVKVSVILPVYGVALYIEKCVDSLLMQTLQEMEFIFVDDHGPDDSIERVKRKIENHVRKDQFKFVKPEHNLGAGMARNYAFQYATGEYIAFVDSDDTIEPTMFEELYNAAKCQEGVDLCYCHAFKDYEDGRSSEILRNPIVDKGDFTREKKSYFLQNYVSLFWTFIYRREYLEKQQIRFPEDRSADDSFFVFCSLILAESVASVDKPFYHYLIRPGSVCTSKVSDKYKKRLSTFSKLLDFAKQRGVYDLYKDEVDYIYIKKGYLTSVFSYLYNSLTPNKSTLKEIQLEIENKIPDFRENPFLKRNVKLSFVMNCIEYFPFLCVKILPPFVRRSNMIL